MKAEIRRFHSPDIFDLASDQPADQERFAILVQVLMGPQGGPGEEAFDILICSLAWVVEEIRKNGVFVGKHSMVVPDWNWAVISKRLGKLFGSVSGDDWESIGNVLRENGRWEMAD